MARKHDRDSLRSDNHGNACAKWIARTVDFYDATYARFDQRVYREIRSETWDEDFGQNGWITAREQEEFIRWLGLHEGQRLLDVACGSGMPVLRIAEKIKALIVGLDIHADGIAAARQHAATREFGKRAEFNVHDAQNPLPFEQASFDAVMCIDAINHFADRPRVLAEWTRVLKPGGKLLFSDPCIVTGPLTNQEIATRASVGFFLFVASDTNDRMLASAGLRIERKSDLTEAVAIAASRWHAARQKRADVLQEIEGIQSFQGQQQFFQTAATLARERRLSRIAYFAVKPT